MMSQTIDTEFARRAVNTIRFLAVDAVEQADSGHPGMPMGTADLAFVLWSRYLRFDPAKPTWPDRDRFVLSAGHGCMLLYALLHLSGYDLPIGELRRFRQWGSRTPGHPEFGHTPGVEATTGPLGQGISNAVGMALAKRMLAARVGRSEEFSPVSHRVFVLASDGDMMEGISGEAASLAGHLGLDGLIVLYDDNHITIEGKTDLAFSEDVSRRYESYGWTTRSIDGHDHAAIASAIDAAIAENERPVMIRCRTQIARGAPTKQGTAESHGAPLGADEVRAAKERVGWPLEPTFFVPDDVRAFFQERAEEGRALRTAWEDRFDGWRRLYPDAAREWDAIHDRAAPAKLTEQLMELAPRGAGATRAHGAAVLQEAAARMPGLVGGSADLAPSTKTLLKGSPSVAIGNYAGRNLHFGIREHAMGAIVNGMLYHGAFRPYGSTFLVFSDYMRPPVRISALAGLPAIWVYTHDSIFVGEDGPTHQPIEHAWGLRLIPGLRVFRPADGLETALAWGMALERTDGPSALLLTRQSLPAIEREVAGEFGDPRRGAYRIVGDGRSQAILAATGSELHLALAARRLLADERISLDVVSIPCVELFEEQEPDYRRRLFPDGARIATIEAGITGPWKALTGPNGLNIGIDQFGSSAPAERLAEAYGLTAESVASRVRAWLSEAD